MNSFPFTAETKDIIKSRVCRFIDNWPENIPGQVTVEKFVKERTDQQNKALFGLAYKIIKDETGHTVDELHDHFCRLHFGEVEYEINGKIHTKPRRTTTRDERGKRDVISWDEFSNFYGLVEQQAAEMCIHIPAPDPKWREKAA